MGSAMVDMSSASPDMNPAEENHRPIPAVQSRIPRIRGWLLVVLGAFLSLGISLLAAYLAWMIARNDQPGGTHWTGSQEMTVKVFELFATIFVFGLVAIAAGILQLRRGRTNWVCIRDYVKPRRTNVLYPAGHYAGLSLALHRSPFAQILTACGKKDRQTRPECI